MPHEKELLTEFELELRVNAPKVGGAFASLMLVVETNGESYPFGACGCRNEITVRRPTGQKA